MIYEDRNNQTTIITSNAEWKLIEQLRAGDETAFLILVEKYQASMVRFAVSYVRDTCIAEEVVQDVWLGVLRSIHRFEGRCALKTWLFHILANCAKTRGKQEGHYLSFSDWDNPSLESDTDFEEDEFAVAPWHFQSSESAWPNHWTNFPERWRQLPEDQALWQEIQACIQGVIENLVPNQRAVITLRDIEGWTTEEVCTALGISQENQRIRLHRARAKVRCALEQYFEYVQDTSQETNTKGL